MFEDRKDAGKKLATALEQYKYKADELVILEMPRFFRAVAQVYRNWYDVSDEEVLEIMNQWKNKD